MEKLDLQTPNITDENVQKISNLFPNCVTEAADGTTQVVDFDLLKQELSSNIVEGNQERYQLTWPGKAESLVTANTPINKTLRPAREESKDFDNTENLYIEGDNLEVLKLLQETYLGKIKMIYIDPPYNTGKDFVYKDNFTQDKAEYDEESGNVDDEGGRLVSNPDSNGRYHSDWLSMMYPRLKLARNLLKDDGVIFISIDDNEVHNLRKICDEIFGESNFIAELIRKVMEGGKSDSKAFAVEHEYVLAYIKKNKGGIYKKPMTDFDHYNKKDDYFKERGAYYLKPLENGGLGYIKTLDYPITGPNGIDIYPGGEFGDNGYRWVWGKDTLRAALDNDMIKFIESRQDSTIYKVYYKIYQFMNSKGEKIERTLPFPSLYLDGYTNRQGVNDIKRVFNGKRGFDYPKPISILKELVLAGCKDGIVLDFFSGSATTAHAVMQLNAEDGGNRKFIMAQIPEATDEKSEAHKAGYKTIAEIGKERIRRAGEKIKTDNADKEGINDLDIGFRVLKVDSSNIEDVHLSPDNTKQNDILNLFRNIKEGRTDEDLLFMVLLDWGIDLSVKIERREVAGKVVYFADDNFLAACFEKNIDEDFVRTLVGNNPLKVVLQDNGFANDSVKINAEQIFKQADIEVKVI